VEPLTSCNIHQYLEKIRQEISFDHSKTPRLNQTLLEYLDMLKQCLVMECVGRELDTAMKWIEHVKQITEVLKSKLGLTGFTYPREFSSFISNPLEHLKKKLFNYAYDLIRGKLSLEEFQRRGAAAVRTSLRTNLRTAYQIWGLAAIMLLLANRGYEVVYPEHRYLSFDRSGKQKLGIIPPNVVLFNIRRGFISIFHEAPRPLCWEDTSDLQRIWGLYTALRPDSMVYGGKVMNIVDLNSVPPIKRPDIILEFKELEEWYTRTRDLKGYFKKPLTAEEWRSKWIEGLYTGLAEVLGIQRTEVKQRVSEGTSLRIREYQLVKLYYSTYKPQKMILVSRTKMPKDIVTELEATGIVVIDNVGFDVEKLEPVVDALDRVASYEGGNRITISLPIETVKLLTSAMEVLNVENPELAIHKALEYLLDSESLKRHKPSHAIDRDLQRS